MLRSPVADMMLIVLCALLLIILDYFSSAFEKPGYRILYEGVETDAQEEFCIACHADYLQGYKFSKPVPIEDLGKFFVKYS